MRLARHVVYRSKVTKQVVRRVIFRVENAEHVWSLDAAKRLARAILREAERARLAWRRP